MMPLTSSPPTPRTLGHEVRLLGMPTDVSAGIDELQPGVLALRVPLRDCLIQVGTADRLPTTTIEVCASPWAVSVQRRDGQPLQAQIVHRRADGTEGRRTVFAEPVGRLCLRRLRNLDGPRLWVVTEGADARNSADLAQLVQTIVCFASAKQRRDAPAPVARPA